VAYASIRNALIAGAALWSLSGTLITAAEPDAAQIPAKQIQADQIQADQIQGARDLSARMTVPVTIDGGGPYHFVVDTGAERTVISRELADRLALAAGQSVTVLSIAGTSRVDTAIVSDLKLTQSRSSALSDLEAPTIAEAHLGAAGMLGIDSLRTKRVVMDFKKMRMSINDANRPPAKDSDEIVVTARRRLGQLILVDAKADGQKISVIIDTGSAVTIGNPALRARLEKRGKLGPVTPIIITSVTGEQTLADYSSIAHARIGSVTIDTMPVAFTDALIFHRLGLSDKPAMLLGMDVLRGFDRVSIDFANKNVRFILPGDAWQSPPPMLATTAAVRAS